MDVKLQMIRYEQLGRTIMGHAESHEVLTWCLQARRGPYQLQVMADGLEIEVTCPEQNINGAAAGWDVHVEGPGAAGPGEAGSLELCASVPADAPLGHVADVVVKMAATVNAVRSLDWTV